MLLMEIRSGDASVSWGKNPDIKTKQIRSPSKFQVEDDTIVGYFFIGDGLFSVSFDKHDYEYLRDLDEVPKLAELAKQHQSVYRCKFSRRDSKTHAEKYLKTGTGNEMLVWTAVLNIMNQFVKQYDPGVVYFTAVPSENRQSLYKRILTTAAKMHNRKSIVISPKNSYHFFIAYKEED